MARTIAAICGGMTASGIGIIRISGPEAFAVLERVFIPGNGTVLPSPGYTCKWDSHTIHYGHITDGEKTIDECLVMFMRAPKTYTTEDVAEIDCHGGPFVMKKILSLLYLNGAEPAEPGEFTKKAFLGGRIDLSRAEAVMDVIRARTDDALTSSLFLLKGGLTDKIRAIRDMILDEVAFIEAAIDDPEHYDTEGYPEKLLARAEEISSRIEKLLSTYREGRIIRDGIRTVILGKPNAGKSTLLNALTGTDRAIVTDTEGTTRDILEESVVMNGILLHLLDTAGIRDDTDDKIEKIGIERALSAAEKAELILAVFDTSKPLDDNDRRIIDAIKGRQAIILLNKTDLRQEISEEDLLSCGLPVVRISAKEEKGLDDLSGLIHERFLAGDIKVNEEILVTEERHAVALKEALSSIEKVKESISLCLPEDFFSIDLMSAYAALGGIIGEGVGEDLINRIFEKFCMGK